MKLSPRDPAAALRDGAALDRAIVAAHRKVVLRHRRLRIPLVIWRDNRVVEVPAESVELPVYDAGIEVPATTQQGDSEDSGPPGVISGQKP